MVEDEKAAGKNLWFKRSGAQMHVGEARQDPLRVLERARYGEIRTIQCFFANRGAKGLEKPLLVIAVLNELTGRWMRVQLIATVGISVPTAISVWLSCPCQASLSRLSWDRAEE